ncbi:MAG: alpha/beta fold hydrolase [Oceanococcaceae bacterium]
MRPAALSELGRRSWTNARDRLLQPASLSQAGRTPFDIIHRNDIVSVRAYSPAQRRHAVPLVLVPPLAVNMLIYDLFPQRSLVGHLLEAGFAVYMIDWGRPTPRHNHWNFAHYVQTLLPEALAAIRRNEGQQRLGLHGWSMGAMFANCYAALGDPDIAHLTLLGPPCDYHAPGGVNWQNRLISRQMQQLQKLAGFQIHATRKRYWRAPGWANSLMFKLASPAGTLRGYTQLLRNLHDREFVQNHATHAAFLEDMVAYPGGLMQDVVQFLLTENRLAQGRLPIADCDASLSHVKAPLLMILGQQDPIISPASSARLLELLSSQDRTVLKVPGGHMSIVSGSSAPSTIWEPMTAWLAERSA